jgi:hypothetical protein
VIHESVVYIPCNCSDQYPLISTLSSKLTLKEQEKDCENCPCDSKLEKPKPTTSIFNSLDELEAAKIEDQRWCSYWCPVKCPESPPCTPSPCYTRTKIKDIDQSNGEWNITTTIQGGDKKIDAAVDDEESFLIRIIQIVMAVVAGAIICTTSIAFLFCLWSCLKKGRRIAGSVTPSTVLSSTQQPLLGAEIDLNRLPHPPQESPRESIA